MDFFCEIFEGKRFLEGPCPLEKEKVQPNNKTCLECLYYNLVLHPKVKVERKKARSDKERDAFLEKWSKKFLADPEGIQWKGNFFDGSLERVYKRLGQHWDPDAQYEHLKDYLLSYGFRFIRETNFQLQVVGRREIERGVDHFKNLCEKNPLLFKDKFEEVKERARSLPEKRMILKPFYSYMLSMAILYEKYTGRKIKHGDKEFLDLIRYCLRSMRLSKPFSMDSIEKMSRKVVKTLSGIRAESPDEVWLMS